ncbi:MAG: sulfite oxidase, partial [Acidimicrobiia bacterium]
IPVVDTKGWRLSVGGRVRRELSVTLDDIRLRPRRSLAVTMECAGNGRALLTPRPISQPWLLEAVSTAEWTGTPLRHLLEEAALLDGAVEVLFTGLDRGIEGGVEQTYQRSLPVEEAMREEVLLAYEINGQPLPPQHGFPLRLVVPGWYGMTNVKWLDAITVLERPFDGHQQAVAYRFRSTDDDVVGVPVTRMAPRALMVPPGIPDFMTRRRFIEMASVTIQGRAWSGSAQVTRVEFSADRGATWSDTELGKQVSPWAWCPWSYTWEPPGPGEYDLACRATDGAGNEQPLDPPWNVGGYANNSPQSIPVTVREA